MKVIWARRTRIQPPRTINSNRQRKLSVFGEYLPPGGINNNAHDASGDGTRNRQGNDPSHITPSDNPPVEGLQVTIAKGNTHSRSNDTLSS